MSSETFQASVRIARPACDVFAWHESPGAVARLLPPWERVEILSADPGVAAGTRVKFRTRVGFKWVETEIERRDTVAGEQFREVALKGPYDEWDHLHRVEPVDAKNCLLKDEVRYRITGGTLKQSLARQAVRTRLDRLFRYRHEVAKQDLERQPTQTSLRILVGGASGLIGRALVPYLAAQGHEVIRLVRRPAAAPDEIAWMPMHTILNANALDGIDAIVNLSGADIIEKSWTQERVIEIRNSRVWTTQTLVTTMRKMHTRPRVFVSASAVGYYGNCGSKILTEDDPPSDRALSIICDSWEESALKAEELYVRTACLRTGLVLTPAGGILGKMLPIFRAGFGGPVGRRKDWISWISMDDHLAAILHAIVNPKVRGVVNSVAPEPVQVGQFAEELGRVLRKPCWLPVPPLALYLRYGIRAEHVLLFSQRALPARLREADFTFRYPTLSQALAHELGQPPVPASSTVSAGG